MYILDHDARVDGRMGGQHHSTTLEDKTANWCHCNNELYVLDNNWTAEAYKLKYTEIYTWAS